jgi:hypothetical protein
MKKIEIKDATVWERTGVKNGNAWRMRSQVGWMDQEKAYPVEVSIPLESDQVPYDIGSYVLSDRSISVGRYGRIEVRPVLDPLKRAAGVAG